MEYGRKYLERHSNIYASRYLNTAIAYKLQNVFQYSVSLQYNCFDTVFTTMYFNTAQLCLWPMTFFGTRRANMSLISARDFWASVHPFLHLSLPLKCCLWVATRGRERINFCLSSLGSDYKACTNHVLLDSV